MQTGRTGPQDSHVKNIRVVDMIVEWRANKKRVNMALPAICSDDPKQQVT